MRKALGVRRLVVIGTLVGLAFAASGPASAVRMVSIVGTASCQWDGLSGTYTAVADNDSCSKVQARVTFINSSGTSVTAYGSAVTGISTASASTTMITGRAGNAAISIAGKDKWAVFGGF